MVWVNIHGSALECTREVIRKVQGEKWRRLLGEGEPLKASASRRSRLHFDIVIEGLGEVARVGILHCANPIGQFVTLATSAAQGRRTSVLFFR